METTVRHGYAASIGSLVCCLVRALTKGVDERADGHVRLGAVLAV